MALAATYKQFLAAPDASLLANDVSLHYITTITTFKGAADIIKVLKGSNGQLKKDKEEFIHAVQGQNALALEVDTALEFLTSGGPYLPGLDDNFLADRKVYLNVTHFVSFDDQGKISQIRQTWDQGSLLKQLDVIGKTGRNWPIRDSREQIRMIESCVKSNPVAASQEPIDVPLRPHGNTASTANVSRDPHTSLNLFGPREDNDRGIETVISPKGGMRPRQRDFAEIFGDEPVEDPDSPSAGRRNGSPSKAIAPKAGAGKNFQPSRLFNTETEDDKASPDETRSTHAYKPHPTKFNHFEFADGSDANDAPRPAEVPFKRTKHSSQWDFDDFATPAKPSKTTKNVRQQDALHWGTGDNEVFDSPQQQRKPVQGKARREAEAHFQLMDDGVPTGEPRPSRPRGSQHNTGLGLYQNNLYNEEGEEDAAFPDEEQQGSRALGVITNQKNHDRNFQPHWNMGDQSPAPETQQAKPAVGEDRKKAVKMMDANWSSYDESPSAQKENRSVLPGHDGASNEDDEPREPGIHIGGDGMGGSRGGASRSWFFGEGDQEDAGNIKPKPIPGRKQAAAKSGGFNWDF